MHTLANWVDVPEGRAALLAIRRVAGCVVSGRKRRTINPLFLHGPAGTGKTHLSAALVAEATSQRPDLAALVLAASDVNLALRPSADAIGPPQVLVEAGEADLVGTEDV